jgi:multidrug efflux pump subunit AcrA (membrane-fusion protein)
LRPPEAAWIEEVLVGEGEMVQGGQEIMRLRSPELELARGRASARVRALEREIGRLRMQADPSGVRLAQLDLEAARHEWAALERRREALRVRAPFAGVIATPHVNELVGAAAQPGDSLIEIWSTGALRVRVALSQRDAGEVTVGDRVRVRFPGDARSVWSTRVMQVGSAAHAEQLDLLAPLGVVPARHGLQPGMVGQAKVAVQQTRVARAFLRSVRRLVRTEQFL